MMVKLLIPFSFLLSLVSAAASAEVNAVAMKTRNEQLLYYGDQPTSYFEQDSLGNKFNNKLTYKQYLSYSQRALALVAGFDSDLHRYDSRDDLINSFGRNLSYRDDLSHMRARIDRRELELLEKQSELTLIENEQNQSKCGQQLALLLEQLTHIMTNFSTHSNSRRLDLLNFVDSFGSPESELMMGNSAWFGSYGQCLTSKFSMKANSRDSSISGKYCVASFKSPAEASKTNEEQQDDITIKMAICLPQSCNSISILRHGDKIESLAKLVRLNHIALNQYKLSNLYCLPDENSPLRQFNLSAKLFIITLSSWLTLVVYFSLKYEYIRMNDFRLMRKTTLQESKLMRALAFRLSWSSLFASASSSSSSSKPSDGQKLQAEVKPQVDLVKIDATTNHLLDTLRSQEHLLDSNGKQQLPLSPAQLVYIVNGSPVKATELNKTTAIESNSIAKVDLSIMDGIKVVSMIWLIMAHTLLFFIRTIANGRDFWVILRDPRYLTVMAGIFPVDTFFTVTGVLTAYLKFNRREAIESPKYWLEALVHRYLRFMPMYLIVFWFARDVSEYLGAGPLWDYSTASTSLRSVCKQESFTVPLLFQANFKPLDHHCVKPAWYLANDYQFLLVAPLFMMLIMRSVRLGYSLIGLSIVASLVAQFLTVFYSQEVEDFGALINFKPMFATYVLKNLWQLYVLPYNRIPPYLIGLLTGHLMYSRGQLSKTQNQTTSVDQMLNGKREEFTSQESLNSPSSSSDEDDTRRRRTTGSESTSNFIHHGTTKKLPPLASSSCTLSDYLCLKVWTPLVCLISIIYFPLLTKLITQEGLAARVGTSSIIALMRFVWSLAIARLIYIAATRFLETDLTKRADCFVIRFLASPMWKPWSKIGLSALLIQWEVIGYLAQTQTSVPDMTMIFLLATMLVSILVTYLLAILIYLTIEYPLSQFEQLYIIPALFHK